MMSGNPFPQNAWLTYAEATARWGKPTSPKQVEYILATPEALADLPAVRALVAEAEERGMEREADDWDALIVEAMTEAEKAMRKFPQPNYVISKFAEESGEVVKAAIHCAEGRESAENLRGEMKQVIAMLYRLWIEGDHIHGLPPVAAAIRQGDPT